MAERIVQVSNLAEFVQEVPTPLHIAGADEPNTVRLMLTEVARSSKDKFNIPLNDIELSLQGINARNEVVWLMWNYTLSFPGDEFMNRQGNSIYRQMPRLYEIVTNWLTAHGYQVSGGRYALPKSIIPLRGTFECAKWVKATYEDGSEFVLQTVENA